MRIQVLTLLVLCSCAPPDAVSSHGVQIWGAGINAEEASVMESTLIDVLVHPWVGTDSDLELSKYLDSYKDAGQLKRCLSEAEVYLQDGLIDGHYPDGQPYRAIGTSARGIITLTKAKCAYRTAYIHELAHWLQECVNNRQPWDYYHVEKALWRAVQIAELQTISLCKLEGVQ